MPDELETTLQSNLDRGLTEGEAHQRLAKDVPNELPEALPVSALTLLLGQSLARGLAGTLQRLEGDPPCPGTTGSVCPQQRRLSLHPLPQTTKRNRRAADRKSAMNSGAALRLLTKGARTRERNIIPPTQLTAASTWSQTRKTVILPADPLVHTHSSCRFVSNAHENGLGTEARLVES